MMFIKTQHSSFLCFDYSMDRTKMVHKNFGRHGQIVPNQFGPPGQMIPKIFCLWGSGNMGTKLVGDHLSRGTKFDGDRLSRGTKLVGDYLSRGTEFFGTTCPWGQEVGDQKSGDQMGSGPNESQP